MDAKRMVNTGVWSDTWFEELECDEKLLWLYLLTNRQTNLIGVYEIGIKRISNETGIEINRLATVMERFANSRKAFHSGKYIVIPNFLRHQTLANPNMEKSALSLFDSLPDEVKKLLKSIGIDDFGGLKEPLPNRLETVTKPLPNRSVIEKEIERETEREKEKKEKSDFEKKSPANFSENGSKNGSEKKPESGIDLVLFGQPEKKEKKKVAAKKKSQGEILRNVVLPFRSDEFRNLWDVWLEHREKIRKPYGDEVAMQAALKKLSGYHEQVAIWAIEDALAAGWQGIFPDKKEYEERLRKNIGQPSGENPTSGFEDLYRLVVERTGKT